MEMLYFLRECDASLVGATCIFYLSSFPRVNVSVRGRNPGNSRTASITACSDNFRPGISFELTVCTSFCLPCRLELFWPLLMVNTVRFIDWHSFFLRKQKKLTFLKFSLLPYSPLCLELETNGDALLLWKRW